MAEKISPLAALIRQGRFGAVDGEPGVRLSQRCCTSLVQVTAFPKSLGLVRRAIKRVTGMDWPAPPLSPSSETMTLIPAGPGRLMVEGSTADLVDRLHKAIPANAGAVTPLDHGRIVVRIAGEKSTWTLAKGIALDFHLSAFPLGTAQMSSHHDIGLTVRRVADEVFDIYVQTSFARSFWHWLKIAASDHGYEIDESGAD